MEIDDPATTVGALDAAAAAAAVVLAALPTATPESTSGQRHAWRWYYMLLRLPLVLIDANVFCALCGEGSSPAMTGAVSRVDSDGQRACEHCGTRLSRCKGKQYKSGPGHICQRCHNAEYQGASSEAAPATASPAAPHPSRKRRAASDPGEPLNLARLRTRASRPSTIPPVKKARVKATPVDISLLLDQTHARRMALIAAEENRAVHGPSSNGSAVVWQP